MTEKLYIPAINYFNKKMHLNISNTPIENCRIKCLFPHFT